jgi:hypothetical protein
MIYFTVNSLLGDLSEQEFFTTLLSVFRERRTLKTALTDAESAINKLDTAVTGFLCFVLVIGYLTLFINPEKVSCVGSIQLCFVSNFKLMKKDLVFCS